MRRRANSRQDIDGVEEDVLVVSRIVQAAGEFGLQVEAERLPPLPEYRDKLLSGLYYLVLAGTRLSALLPCTVNIVLKKPG